MSHPISSSPDRPNHDLEAGSSRSGNVNDDESWTDPFDMNSTKYASVERLKRWRKAALVLNSSRRFRYTLNLKKEEEKKQTLRKIRAHAQAIRAASLYAEVGNPLQGTLQPIASAASDFQIAHEQLVSVIRDRDLHAMQQYGGVSGLADLLKTNLHKGILGDSADCLNRKNAFGSNTYPPGRARSFWTILWEAWQDLTLIILMIAAVATLGLHINMKDMKEEWYGGGSIALAVILVIVVIAISDYNESLRFQSLIAERRNIHLEVIRGGRRVEVSIYDIVVGDVVPLSIGDQVPADGILITGYSLATEETQIIGDSKIVHKDCKDPFLMSGCKIANGSGTMLVTSVGMNTEWGLLMASISEDIGEETPLQVGLNGVATVIGLFGIVIALFVFNVDLVRLFTGHSRNPDGTSQFVPGKTGFEKAIQFTIIVVTNVMVAVPEGLPIAVTLILVYSMTKMMADKILVRRQSACEAIGSATTICIDKTGLLTSNQMTVVEAYVGGKKIYPSDNKSRLSPMLWSLIIESIAQNTNGSVYMAENGGDVEVYGSPTEKAINGGDVEVYGSPTEKAILRWGIKIGMNFEATKSESTVLHALAFNSVKKRSAVALKLANSQVHIHWKGAAETILASCTKYIDANDHLVAMDEDKLMFFNEAIEGMASGSLRCVAIAYRLYEFENVPTDEQLVQWALPEDDLILLAIVGIEDPCQPGVRDAVRQCQNAGVKVCMVTGDNLQTAKAIALECGILGSEADATEQNIIEGRVFRAFSDKQREDLAERISVMGRSSPNDKLLLVQALKKRGHVVAVTGDGCNDAPALYEADIGLAMGIQGAEVAKESSDIIILDNNFSTIVKAIKWGRSVYSNIQKFTQFHLTVGLAALIINVIAEVSSGSAPLNAVQILWVSIIMDTQGALVLRTEPPSDNLMRKPPVDRKAPLITNIVWRNLLVQSFYQVTILLILNFHGRNLLNLELADYNVMNTMIFNAFVLCQIFNEFNARKPEEYNIFKGITSNYLFLGIVGITLVLQIVAIEFLGKFTSTVRLNLKQWLISIIIGFICWPLDAIGKLLPVPKTPFIKFALKLWGDRFSSICNYL